jgi:DnaJ-class molecular chaperone
MSAPTDSTYDPTRCSPCRGTGKLLSKLGGDEHEVTCPWCGGTGVRDPARDAQEHPAER